MLATSLTDGIIVVSDTLSEGSTIFSHRCLASVPSIAMTQNESNVNVARVKAVKCVRWENLTLNMKTLKLDP